VSIVRISRRLWRQGSVPGSPYRVGDRIASATGDGGRYVGRVDTVRAGDDGTYTVLAALREPRHLRGHLLATVVDSAGRVTVPA
jgi:hypothetical protein